MAEWRLAEPAQQPLFIQSQMSRTVRFSMCLDDEGHEVPVLEEGWAVYRVGNPPRLKISSEYTRGPASTVSTHRAIHLGDDGRLEAPETFRYNSSELRDPLQDTILGSGWTWRGVILGKL